MTYNVFSGTLNPTHFTPRHPSNNVTDHPTWDIHHLQTYRLLKNVNVAGITASLLITLLQLCKSTFIAFMFMIIYCNYVFELTLQWPDMRMISMWM